MKKIKIIFLSLIALASIVSCTEDSDKLTGDATTGGLVEVSSKLVGYVVGNGNDFKYTATFTPLQGEDITTKSIEVYKVFTNIAGKTSNEVLLKTIVVTDAKPVTFDFTYNELIKDLKVDGSAISSNDGLLNIGDAWTLKYVSKTSQGSSSLNSATTKVAVGTRFAGKYKVITGKYWRINVLHASNWDGQERIIESVDAQTYRFLNFAGPFENVTNTHYFTIDGSGVVKTPVTYNGVGQLLNGLAVINCFETPNNMTNACGFAGPQNTVVKDDVTGKDRIYRSYGYINPASGSREFYEVLEKVVE
jgi:hypothetical protein